MADKITIDLVTCDPGSDEFVIYLVEDGPWPISSESWDQCLARIQTRVLDAVDVAVDGQFAQEFPNSIGKKIRVQVDSPHGVPDKLTDLVRKLDAYVHEDSEYGHAIRDSGSIRTVRIVTGHAMGRFGGS
jgi:hypothetical protein